MHAHSIEMAETEPPWFDRTQLEAMSLIAICPAPTLRPMERDHRLPDGGHSRVLLQQLMRNMLVKAPHARAAASDLMQEPLFGGALQMSPSSVAQMARRALLLAQADITHPNTPVCGTPVAGSRAGSLQQQCRQLLQQNVCQRQQEHEQRQQQQQQHQLRREKKGPERTQQQHSRHSPNEHEQRRGRRNYVLAASSATPVTPACVSVV